MTDPAQKRFIKALKGQVTDRPPIWLMRQAGRYLPEYRETRAKAGSFLDLCYNPELACEVTLQPLRRYDFDAAILFADILLLPHAMGQHLEFLEGEGPKFDPITDAETLAKLKPEDMHKGLEPVYETVRRLKAAIPPETALIGFAGAPWTVATYMLGGKGPAGHDAARVFAYRHPDLFATLMEILTEATADYLIAQVDAGAEAVQLFDSWAGGLPTSLFCAWVIAPAQRITTRINDAHPHIPVIGFPRAAGPLYEAYFQETRVHGVSLDTGLDPIWARDHLQKIGPVQGNLDPMALVAGGDALKREVAYILDCLGRAPYIFNLGHGIVPETPPEHVAELVSMVRSWNREAASPQMRG